MREAWNQRPQPGEYGDYYETYLQLVPEDSALAVLRDQAQRTWDFLHKLGEKAGQHRYAPGKWSVKEVVGHLCDTEWIFAVRALRIARGDATPQPGYDQEAYVAAAGFDHLALKDLAEEYRLLRLSSLRLFSGLRDEMALFRGEANGLPLTARAVPFILAGHERHHLKVIIERYL
jgi:hypothetical protein